MKKNTKEETWTNNSFLNKMRRITYNKTIEVAVRFMETTIFNKKYYSHETCKCQYF